MNLFNKYVIVLAAFCVQFTAYGQSRFESEIFEKGRSFYDVQKEVRAEIAKDPDNKLVKKWGRFESFYEPRVYPHGDVSTYMSQTIQATQRFRRTLKQHAGERSPHGDWTFLGPQTSPDGSFGRCLDIEFHPSDTNILYVLTSSAGLWKSEDYGITWASLTDDLPLLYAIDFAVDPNDPDIIYLLTGNNKQSENNFIWTRGILKTTNGGQTWFRPGFEYFGSILPYRLVMHPDPDSSEVMFTATGEGIHRTEDGWRSGELVLPQVPGVETRDIEFKPGDPSIMYASMNNKIYRSTSRGLKDTWDEVTDADFGALATMRRTELAVSPANPSAVYAVASNNTNDILYRSMSNGADDTWTIQSDANDSLFSAVSYNFDIAVDPTNINTVYACAVPLWKSTNAGATWTDKFGTHVDHHTLIFNGTVLYDLNDGGVARSYDGGDTWTDITAGIQVFECYTIAGTPQDATKVYVGGQDTGGNRIESGGKFEKIHPAGDVTMLRQDPTDTDRAYLAAQYGGLQFTTDSWSSRFSAGPGSGPNELDFEPEYGQGIWLCPYEMDVSDSKRLFTGADSIWRLDTDEQFAQFLGEPQVGKTRAIAQGIDDPTRLYVIHDDSLFFTTQALTNSPSGAYLELH